MKKFLGIILAVAMMMAMPACVLADSADAATEPAATSEPKSEGVMTYDEYVAADLDSQVVVETYVQAKQSWWEDKATFYTQDMDGAYFVYNMPCTQEEYDALVPGTKIKVTGYKAEWSGEVEIIDATYEIEEGEYVAPATDVTELLGTDELINYQNRFVSVPVQLGRLRHSGRRSVLQRFAERHHLHLHCRELPVRQRHRRV